MALADYRRLFFVLVMFFFAIPAIASDHWELVLDWPPTKTTRLRVETGWIVRVEDYIEGESNSVFVYDPTHSWGIKK